MRAGRPRAVDMKILLVVVVDISAERALWAVRQFPGSTDAVLQGGHAASLAHACSQLPCFTCPHRSPPQRILRPTDCVDEHHQPVLALPYATTSYVTPGTLFMPVSCVASAPYTRLVISRRS